MYLGLDIPITSNVNYLFSVTKESLEQRKAEIKNLLLTQKGERILNIDFGCNLLQYLFENNPSVIKIQEEIESCIERYFTDIEITNIEIVPEEHQLIIKITFLWYDLQDQLELVFS